MTSTLDFYAENAKEFFDRTIGLNLSALYSRFLPEIPVGGKILDAGCGSGRDTRYFKDAGYQVTAFDAIPELARMASDLTNLEVKVSRFEDFDSNDHFDGIWACASLLHVPEKDLSSTIKHLGRFLKDNGFFYMSFKYGHGETARGTRSFTDMDEEGVSWLEKKLTGPGENGLKLIESWISEDRRLRRSSEQWMNLIWKK